MNNYLDDNGNGTLAVLVFIKCDAASPLIPIPSNPMSGMIMGMFLDEKTADVCFEVSSDSEDIHEDVGGEAASSPVTFHAHTHSFIPKV